MFFRSLRFPSWPRARFPAAAATTTTGTGSGSGSGSGASASPPRWRAAVAAAVGGVLLLTQFAACGGGGGTSSDELDRMRRCGVGNFVVRPGSFDGGHNGGEGDGTGAGGSGSGDAGDAGGNGGDAGGNEGQFRNTRVEIRNRQMDVVAVGQTDPVYGMINLSITACDAEPIEISFIGGDGAEYYDEVTGRYEPYASGSQLRVRLTSFARNVSANAYTEAAVQLMDAEAGGRTVELDAARIREANLRIGREVQNQLPGIYRSRFDAGASRQAGGLTADLKEGDADVLDITRIVRPINAETLTRPGSFDDSANGRYGAVLAGLGIVGGFAGDVDRPASRINALIAADLADGRFDLQRVAPGGTTRQPAPLITLTTGTGARPRVTEPIPYTYDTLWRAKSATAGGVAVAAGDTALRTNTEATAIAAYTASTRLVYRVSQGDAEAGSNFDFSTGTVGTQTVNLFADGRLLLTRTMSAGFSARRWWNTEDRPLVLEPSPGIRFGDVRVGSRSDVIALQADRRQLTYIAPFELYRVRGNENAEDEAASVALLDQANRQLRTTTVAVPQSRAEYRILGAVPGPERRLYPGRRTAPAVLMLLTDGSLWGVDPTADGPAQPFEIPVPEPMQQVVFDHFPAPTFADPAYGSASGLTEPASPGNRGHRRLFGLTTRGTVSTWIEGLDAPGRELAIPGRVVLLSAESKTHVYALTTSGEVYWINADQALDGLPATLVAPRGSLAGYTRRYPLNRVVPVDLGTHRACWIARAEAVLCDSGEVRAWDEWVSPIQFAENDGGSPDDRVLLPNNITPSRSVVPTGIWRINAAQEDFVIVEAVSRVTVGATYLRVDGPPLDAGSAQGKRNLLNDAPVRAVRGEQLVAALREIYAPTSPLLKAFVLNSALAWDARVHDLLVQPGLVSTGRYRILLGHQVPVGGGAFETDPHLPDVGLTLATTSAPTRFSLQPIRLEGGDPATVPPGGDLSGAGVPAVFDVGQDYPINTGLDRWTIRYAAPLLGDGPAPYVGMVLRDVAGDPYAFRICFDINYQVRLPAPERNSVNGLSICTVHESDGRFRNLAGSAGYTLYTQGGELADRALHDIDWGSQIYLPY